MKIKGQSLVEFVLVAPLIVLIVFAIIELALYWKAVQTVQEMALEAGAGAAAQIVRDTHTSGYS